MSLNRCRLTPEGIKVILNALNRLGLDENLSELHRQTGLDRSTLGKILRNRGAVHYGKIQTLWRWVDDALQEKTLEGITLKDKDFVECEGNSVAQISKGRSPHLKSKSRSTHQHSVPHKQEVVKCLWALDYQEQERLFLDHYDTHPATAFCVHAQDPYSLWVVKRLAQQISDWETARKPAPIVVGTYWDFGRLWEELACGLEIAEESEPEKVLDAVCTICKSESIVLLIQGVNNWKQETAEQFLREFWHPLSDRIAQQIRSPRSQLVLLLTHPITKQPSNFQSLLQEEDYPFGDNPPILLKALDKIRTSDVQRWFRRESYFLLEDFIRSKRSGEPEAQCRDLLENCIVKWEETPDQVFQCICDVFEIGGVMEFAEYWKLAG